MEHVLQSWQISKSHPVIHKDHEINHLSILRRDGRSSRVANHSVVGPGVVLQQGKDGRRRVKWPGMGEWGVWESMDGVVWGASEFERKGGR